MRTHLTRRTIPWTLAAALLLAAGCGDDDTDASEGSDGDRAAPAEADGRGDSAYCDAAARVGGLRGGRRSTTPIQRRSSAYWAGVQHRVRGGVLSRTAPEELKADWELKVETEDETVVPVLEKYGYSIDRYHGRSERRRSRPSRSRRPTSPQRRTGSKRLRAPAPA